MELLGESLVISLLVGLIVAWTLHKIVRLTGFGAISTIAAGMLGALIGVWLTPGARDIIPAVIDLSPIKLLSPAKLPEAKVAEDNTPENDLLSWAPPPYQVVMLPLGPLRPMMKPSPTVRARNLQFWLKRSAATICPRISSFAWLYQSVSDHVITGGCVGHRAIHVRLLTKGSR
jgi:hypothetical protein